MSFDDVARRMQQRENSHPLTGLDMPSQSPQVYQQPQYSQPPDQYLVEMAARERSSKAQSNIWIGAILMTLGIIVTAATYNSASQSGGTYVIAYGPIIFGAIRLIRGLAG